MSSTANGLTILEAVVTVPRSGPWHADVTVDTDDPTKLAAPVTLSLVDGALSLVATPWRDPKVWRGVTRARLVGGAAGLRTVMDAGSYWTSTVRTVLLDILGATGERVSPTVAESLLATELDHWVRIASSAGAALHSLANEFDLVWRVLPDGTVWIGVETWPDPSAFDYVILDQHVENATMTIGADLPVLLPGVMFEGQKVGRVVHRLGADHVRTDVYFE